MSRATFALVVLAGWVCARTAAAPFVVHEWGTFTSVHASDGSLLPGLEREEHRLPNFVRSHAGFSPADKGWIRPVKNVTIKMETPVLYFYSDREFPVSVEVGFRGGSISQWYPERSGGEQLPPVPQERTSATPPVDFAHGYDGGIRWDVTVLAPATPETINNPRAWETPQWPRARVNGANLIKGPPGMVETGRADFQADGPVVEGFLFYRGIGNFGLPLRITTGMNGEVTVENTGAGTLDYLLVYRNDAAVGVRSRELRNLAPGERRRVPPLAAGPLGIHDELVRAGLTAAEAAAMLATWRESYFEQPGLRIFWIVPRAFTDKILPLAITPAPDRLERVLVGRSEVLTPAFEQELADGFRADGGARWINDRYFLAYRERARQLGLEAPANRP